ncbi:MAG TPA: SRPBCC family protein [Intrasporangium sp.]|nr:SRPBCC family protein [Intrasporangium sp.]
MSSFEVTRSQRIEADPARIHALVNNFREWRAWSPWEDLDPDLHREYSGAESGEGARYSWKGNRKAGAGTMVITSSTPRVVSFDLTFLKPFKASNQFEFDLHDVDGGTEVTWRMTGEQKGLAGLFARFYPMEKLVGPDFEKGLDRLKAAAEKG